MEIFLLFHMNEIGYGWESNSIIMKKYNKMKRNLYLRKNDWARP